MMEFRRRRLCTLSLAYVWPSNSNLRLLCTLQCSPCGGESGNVAGIQFKQMRRASKASERRNGTARARGMVERCAVAGNQRAPSDLAWAVVSETRQAGQNKFVGWAWPRPAMLLSCWPTSPVGNKWLFLN